MANTHPDGTLPSGDLHQQDLLHQGYQPCRNQLCDHMFDPNMLDALQEAQGKNATHQCSHCGLEQFPFLTPGRPGGGTNSGLNMDEQAQIGEDLVEAMGTIPGYGTIQWWHQGGAATNSALDGATETWGIEVKTYNWTIQRKRGIISPRDKRLKVQAINDPSLFAEKMKDPLLDKVLHQFNWQGLLGILVLLDFGTGLADIFAHEMREPSGGPLEYQHVKHITRQVVLAEGVPFQHSLPDPRQPDWVPYHEQQAAVTNEPTPF